MMINILLRCSLSSAKIASSTAERSAPNGNRTKNRKKIVILFARVLINDYFCNQTAHNDDRGNIYYNNKSTNRQHDET